MVPLWMYLVVAAAIFCIGVYGVLARRNAVAILMSVELMLSAVNINLVAFWRFMTPEQMSGQVFAAFVFVIAAAEAAINHTLAYVRQRKAFGKTVLEFQNTRFKLAERQTEVTIGQVFIDHCIEKLMAGKLDASTASMAKWWGTQKQCEIVDECLQFFGGFGYMLEYPIARLYQDARVQKIYGGTNEIMKELIARGLE